MGKIQDSTINPGKKTKIRELIDNFGLPRLIIAGFLLALFILAPIVGADLPTQITNTINRFSWNAVLVLAMVPMVHSGCGLNFGLPLGIISGLLGATMSIQFGFTGPVSFFMAILIATPFALIFGGGYGWLLNKIKGGYHEPFLFRTHGEGLGCCPQKRVSGIIMQQLPGAEGREGLSEASGRAPGGGNPDISHWSQEHGEHG